MAFDDRCLVYTDGSAQVVRNSAFSASLGEASSSFNISEISFDAMSRVVVDPAGFAQVKKSALTSFASTPERPTLIFFSEGSP